MSFYREVSSLKQILCLSNEPWSTSPGRTQQLLSRLRDTQILYFAPPAGRRDRSFRQKGQKVRPNVTVYTLPPTLFPVSEQYSRLFLRNQRKLGRFIADKAARHRFQSPLLWTTSPEQVHLLDHLEYDGLVYDCDRDWEELPPLWEGALANNADIVFAASPLLADRLSPCSSNIAQLPNGVNYPMFSGEGGSIQSDPLPQVHGPVLGRGHPPGTRSVPHPLRRQGAAWLDLPAAGPAGGQSPPSSTQAAAQRGAGRPLPSQ